MIFMNCIDKYTAHTYITKNELSVIVKQIGDRINNDYRGKEVVLLGILNGCIMFYSDLLKTLNIPCIVQFIQLSSYNGTHSTGKVTEINQLNIDLSNRHVIIIEDIIDTGLTIKHMLERLQCAESVEICTLLFKKENFKEHYDIKYIGKEISNKFVVGYGMDLDGYYRNLNEIYILE